MSNLSQLHFVSLIIWSYECTIALRYRVNPFIKTLAGSYKTRRLNFRGTFEGSKLQNLPDEIWKDLSWGTGICLLYILLIDVTQYFTIVVTINIVMSIVNYWSSSLGPHAPQIGETTNQVKYLKLNVGFCGEWKAGLSTREKYSLSREPTNSTHNYCQFVNRTHGILVEGECFSPMPPRAFIGFVLFWNDLIWGKFEDIQTPASFIYSHYFRNHIFSFAPQLVRTRAPELRFPVRILVDPSSVSTIINLSLIHIWRCRRS